jgi:hypothetical protein
MRLLQDRNGHIIARKAGTGRVKGKAIDAVLSEYIHPSALLCVKLKVAFRVSFDDKLSTMVTNLHSPSNKIILSWGK